MYLMSLAPRQYECLENKKVSLKSHTCTADECLSKTAAGATTTTNSFFEQVHSGSFKL